jgi:hypothetical protein
LASLDLFSDDSFIGFLSRELNVRRWVQYFNVVLGFPRNRGATQFLDRPAGVASGILPEVEGGILPPGKGVDAEKDLG